MARWPEEVQTRWYTQIKNEKRVIDQFQFLRMQIDNFAEKHEWDSARTCVLQSRRLAQEIMADPVLLQQAETAGCRDDVKTAAEPPRIVSVPRSESVTRSEPGADPVATATDAGIRGRARPDRAGEAAPAALAARPTSGAEKGSGGGGNGGGGAAPATGPDAGDGDGLEAQIISLQGKSKRTGAENAKLLQLLELHRQAIERRAEQKRRIAEAQMKANIVSNFAQSNAKGQAVAVKQVKPYCDDPFAAGPSPFGKSGY